MEAEVADERKRAATEKRIKLEKSIEESKRLSEEAYGKMADLTIRTVFLEQRVHVVEEELKDAHDAISILENDKKKLEEEKEIAKQENIIANNERHREIRGLEEKIQDLLLKYGEEKRIRKQWENLILENVEYIDELYKEISKDEIKYVVQVISDVEESESDNEKNKEETESEKEKAAEDEKKVAAETENEKEDEENQKGVETEDEEEKSEEEGLDWLYFYEEEVD